MKKNTASASPSGSWYIRPCLASLNWMIHAPGILLPRMKAFSGGVMTSSAPVTTSVFCAIPGKRS